MIGGVLLLCCWVVLAILHWVSSGSELSPGIYAGAAQIDEVRDVAEFIVGDVLFAEGGVGVCAIPFCMSRQNAAP